MNDLSEHFMLYYNNLDRVIGIDIIKQFFRDEIEKSILTD